MIMMHQKCSSGWVSANLLTIKLCGFRFQITPRDPFIPISVASPELMHMGPINNVVSYKWWIHSPSECHDAPEILYASFMQIWQSSSCSQIPTKVGLQITPETYPLVWHHAPLELIHIGSITNVVNVKLLIHGFIAHRVYYDAPEMFQWTDFSKFDN